MVVGLVLAGLGLVVVVAVFISAVRADGFRADRHSPLWAVSWSRRRQLAWTIRRGGEVPEEDLPLLRHTAELLAGQRWLIGLFVGLAIIYAGQSLLQWSPFRLALLPVMVSLYAVAVVLALRNARRGEAFLRAHPAPGEDPQDRATSLI
ncbi:MAG TPA: hypothetical protein VF462_16870 [Micromonosporaceae bacterium]